MGGRERDGERERRGTDIARGRDRDWERETGERWRQAWREDRGYRYTWGRGRESGKRE